MRYEEALEKHQPLSPFERGLVAGIYRYAWMKDGSYYVGTTGSLLGDAIDRSITEHRESNTLDLLAGRYGPQPIEPAPDVDRPDSVPREGQIAAFDAGWDAHKAGLERKTVEVLSPNEDARGWALMGWDVREQLTKESVVGG